MEDCTRALRARCICRATIRLPPGGSFLLPSRFCGNDALGDSAGMLYSLAGMASENEEVGLYCCSCPFLSFHLPPFVLKRNQQSTPPAVIR
jgi:hypothetical protein